MIRKSSWLTMALAFGLILLLAMGCGGGASAPTAAPTSTLAPPTATPRPPTPTPVPPTATATPQPTHTPTLPPPTNTPTDIPAPAATAPPLPAGWRDHSVSGFRIALPERWETVDVDQEGIEAIFDMLETLDTEWARNLTATFSAEAVREAIKFWAMDPEPAGTGYASMNVNYQSSALPVEIGDTCAGLESAYEQLGVELIDMQCGLKINGLDAGRSTTRLPAGPLAAKQYQYFYVQGRSLWAVTLAVDETVWSDYESIFATAGESFRVD